MRHDALQRVARELAFRPRFDDWRITVSETYVRAGNVQWIAKGTDVGVQERTLAPGQEIPWHYHTVITDTTCCLEGTVQIEMLGPPERVLLSAGQRHGIPAHRPHRITPYGDRPCRFLLVQGVGAYDRHPVDPATWTPASQAPPIVP